jgi:hypothetical protein
LAGAHFSDGRREYVHFSSQRTESELLLLPFGTAHFGLLSEDGRSIEQQPA